MKKYVIASGLTETALDKLFSIGISVLDFPPNRSVMKEIAGHADISFFYAGENTLFIAKEMSETSHFFESLGYNVIVLNENLGRAYPADVKLNCVCIGKRVICNADTVSPCVLKFFKDKHISVVNVKQGYSKCSVVPVGDNALITDDPSIAEACEKVGMEVLQVSKGGVKLTGFPYGFIGGASGVIAPDKIVFNGDINTHPDHNKINDFLFVRNIKCISLCEGDLIDIGSIITLY